MRLRYDLATHVNSNVNIKFYYVNESEQFIFLEFLSDLKLKKPFGVPLFIMTLFCCTGRCALPCGSSRVRKILINRTWF